jgi:hypothetical protein
VNEEEFRKQSIKKLDELGSKIDALIQVVAITSRKDIVTKGKKKTDQIVALSNLGLSNDVIALIVGSTPEAVRVRLTQLKAKKGRKTKRS